MGMFSVFFAALYGKLKCLWKKMNKKEKVHYKDQITKGLIWKKIHTVMIKKSIFCSSVSCHIHISCVSWKSESFADQCDLKSNQINNVALS